MLGHRPVSAVDDALINEALAPIWRNKAETASRVKQRIVKVREWVKGACRGRRRAKPDASSTTLRCLMTTCPPSWIDCGAWIAYRRLLSSSRS